MSKKEFHLMLIQPQFSGTFHQQTDEVGSISPREVPVSIGGGRGSRGSHLDPENEITRNRDFYRAHDVRPPFTYAALIRQVSP